MRRWLRAAQLPEDSLAARMAVLATALIALAGLAFAAGAVVTATVCAALVCIGHYVSWRGRHRRRTQRGQALLGILICLCLTYLVTDLALSLFGGALPQAKFAVMTLAVTSFDLKSRRNLYSHVWHSLAILYVGALFAWDFTYLAFLVPWAGALALFLLASRRDARLPQTLSGIRSALGRGGLRLAPWALLWIVLGGVAFIGLPRVAGRPIAVPVLVSIPLNPNSSAEVLPAVLPLVGAAPGGSQEGSINLRARGALGDEVMFRVRAPAASYWRAYVLEGYDGQSWSRVLHPAQPIPPVSTGLPIDDEHTTVGPSLPQTFYIERPLPAEVIASYPMRELYFPASGLVLVDTGTVNTPIGLRKGVNYSVVSQVRDLSPNALRQAAPLTGREDPSDLSVPGGVPPRVKRLARELSAGQPTEYDQVRAIADHLRQTYPYSLATPRLPSGADAVDQFLFVDKVGFCEQFASALAVMLREVGIPTRLAIGYSTGDRDTLTGTFTVHARDAHAWVEVQFPSVGWVPFDASPGFDSIPIAHQPARWFLSDFSPQVALTAVGGVGGAATGFGALALVALLVVILILVLRRTHHPMAPELRAYQWAQRWIRWAGLPDRAPPQTPAEHLEALQAVAPGVAARLAPLRVALEKAVYGGSPRRARRPGHLGVLASALVYSFGGGR